MITAEQAKENKDRVQKESLLAWEAAGCQGCLELATGVGKTRVGLNGIEFIRHGMLLEDKEAQILIVVPTESLRDIDWPEEAKFWDISLENVRIVCYATLSKVDFSKYSFIIFDECHRLTLPGLNKLKKLLEDSPLFPYLGLTATLPRPSDFSEDFERIALALNLFTSVYKISTDEAVELGLIADFEIKVLLFDLDSSSLNIPGGTKLKPFKQTESGRYAYLTSSLKRATIMAKTNPAKMGFKFAAIQKRTSFLYDLPSKRRLASLCIERLRPQGRIIVFCGTIEQAEALCGKDVFHSKSSAEALDRFQSKQIDLLGAVKALNEGKNLVQPDIGIIVQVDSVDRNLIQRIGRLVRVRYDNMAFKAQIIILVAKNTADEKWFNESISNFDTKRISKILVNVPK